MPKSDQATTHGTVEVDGNDGCRVVVAAPRRAARHTTVSGLTMLVVALAASAMFAATTSARTAPTRQRHVRLVLTFKVDGAALERRALAVSMPGSPLYGHYSTIAATSRRFGASAKARARVRAYLRANGATGIRIDATGLFSQATMSLRHAEALFATPVTAFRTADGARFIAPTSRVRVPQALSGAVDAVLGLDTRPLLEGSAELPPQRGRAHAAAASQPSSEQGRTGTPSGCAAGVAAGEVNGDPATGAFTPNQYLSAYNYDLVHAAGLQGQGQRVALIEADGVSTSDVSSFASCFGFGPPAIHQFAVGGIRKRPPGLETILDAEILAAAAPGLSSIDIYETKPDLSDMLMAFTAPLQRAKSMPSVISTSLGLCEAQANAALGLNGKEGLKIADLALAAAVQSGVTIVSASGDTGSAGCQTARGLPIDRLGVLYPASSWWSIAVGGTNLFLTSSNQIADEVVWNDAGLHLGAGGGGFSALLTRPPAQNGVVRTNHRAVPDVSMLADVMPGFAVYCTTPECRHAAGSTGWIRAGGTSAAAPLFAGAVALIDQELKAQDRAPIGDPDPLLYTEGMHPLNSMFNDVTRIGNDIGPFIPGSGRRPLGCCSATPGYDEGSGWGSVNVAAFSQSVAQLAPLLPPNTLGGISFAVPPHQQPVKANSLATRVTCSKPCQVLADVVVAVGTSQPFEILSRIYRLPSGGPRSIRFRFTKPQLRKLRSALNRNTQIVALGYGILTNSHGRFQKYSVPHEFKITG